MLRLRTALTMRQCDHQHSCSEANDRIVPSAEYRQSVGLARIVRGKDVDDDLCCKYTWLNANGSSSCGDIRRNFNVQQFMCKYSDAVRCQHIRGAVCQFLKNSGPQFPESWYCIRLHVSLNSVEIDVSLSTAKCVISNFS
jgi:hypothetical protein